MRAARQQIADSCYLVEGLETVLDARNKGYATFLLKAAADHIRNEDPEPTLPSDASNPASIKAHRNADFVIQNAFGDSRAWLILSK